MILIKTLQITFNLNFEKSCVSGTCEDEEWCDCTSNNVAVQPGCLPPPGQNFLDASTSNYVAVQPGCLSPGQSFLDIFLI